MWILIAIGFLLPLVYIGYLLSKLDKFLDQGGFNTDENQTGPVAIVLGKTSMAREITRLLEENNISVLNIVEPFLLEQEQNFCYLFALSESDVDNIVLCRLGKKLYSIEKIISFCNDEKNERIFSSENIPYMIGDNITPQMLYEIVLQEDEVKI